MKNNDPGILELVHDYNRRVQKYYWAAAILFWLGAVMTLPYYIVQTGTEPSWIPGILMISGVVLYIIVRRTNN